MRKGLYWAESGEAAQGCERAGRHCPLLPTSARKRTGSLGEGRWKSEIPAIDSTQPFLRDRTSPKAGTCSIAASKRMRAIPGALGQLVQFHSSTLNLDLGHSRSGGVAQAHGASAR